MFNYIFNILLEIINMNEASVNVDDDIQFFDPEVLKIGQWDFC